jgi:hypothetical protein
MVAGLPVAGAAGRLVALEVARDAGIAASLPLAADFTAIAVLDGVGRRRARAADSTEKQSEGQSDSKSDGSHVASEVGGGPSILVFYVVNGEWK